MRTILVDDEPKNVRVLNKLLTDYCSNVKIIGSAGDANTAQKLIEELKPELVFLDIEMPNGNAFDLLDKLMPINFEIIFITAFENYSLKAFKYSALDYLLKPVSIEDLQDAVIKAQNKNRASNITLQIKSLLQSVNNVGNSIQKVAIHTFNALEFVKVEDIIRLEAKGGYSEFYLTNKKILLATKNIKEYEEILSGDPFFRIHNSHIINLNAIKKYYKGRGGYIIMDDDTKIEVANRRKNDFLARFE